MCAQRLDLAAGIASDACAAHLLREPASPWRFSDAATSRRNTLLVRIGRTAPVGVDVARFGRPGMMGRVALFGVRIILWEICVAGSDTYEYAPHQCRR